MRSVFSALIISAIFLSLSGELGAGQSRATLRASGASGNTASSSLIANGQRKHKRGNPGYPIYRNGYYYQPYASPVLVISPYSGSYYLPPTVVVTSPYFCVLHNEGFVSRIGLLDHLSSSMHRIPLDVAASICPDGVSSCVFPSY